MPNCPVVEVLPPLRQRTAQLRAGREVWGKCDLCALNESCMGLEQTGGYWEEKASLPWGWLWAGLGWAVHGTEHFVWVPGKLKKKEPSWCEHMKQQLGDDVSALPREIHKEI